MNLLPEDLGEKRCRILAARRAGRPVQAVEDAPPRVGFWGRRWLGKQKGQISAEEAQATLKAIRTPARVSSVVGLLPAPGALGFLLDTLSHIYSPPGVFYYGHPPTVHDWLPALLSAGATGTWAWFFTFARPRRLVARKYRALYERAVTPGEVAALLPQAHDELERSYLTLVMDVVRQEVASVQEQGPASGTDLRSALRALGDAIDKLPATRAVGHLSLGGETPDIMTEVLRRTAAKTLLLAQAEPDRVVAASLIRRVEALHRRADATTRANVLVRRFSVLRQEMAAETEALRASLAAYYTGAHDIADLTSLAEDMQRVASEAAAMTAAVEEVDAWMLEAPTRPQSQPDTAPARVQLGQG